MERKDLFFPRYISSLCYSEIQCPRVNGVTLLRVLINEPRAPSSPYPTSFSPLDSTPSIFNHKEVSAPPPPPRLSRLLLWPVIVSTYIYICIHSFFYLLAYPFAHFTCLNSQKFFAHNTDTFSNLYRTTCRIRMHEINSTYYFSNLEETFKSNDN